MSAPSDVALVDEPIPAVCFIDDLVRHLRLSRRAIERARRHGTFPIREMPTLDDRPRWRGSDVRTFRESKR